MQIRRIFGSTQSSGEIKRIKGSLFQPGYKPEWARGPVEMVEWFADYGGSQSDDDQGLVTGGILPFRTPLRWSFCLHAPMSLSLSCSPCMWHGIDPKYSIIFFSYQQFASVIEYYFVIFLNVFGEMFRSFRVKNTYWLVILSVIFSFLFPTTHRRFVNINFSILSYCSLILDLMAIPGIGPLPEQPRGFSSASTLRAPPPLHSALVALCVQAQSHQLFFVWFVTRLTQQLHTQQLGSYNSSMNSLEKSNSNQNSSQRCS